MKTYKTHTELLKLDGKTVRFDYRGKTYKGKIRVENGYIYLCQDEFAGAGCLDRLGFEYSTMLFESDGSQTSSPCANIRLYKKTLDDLEQGDIVMDKYGEYKVLGVCGELYFIRGVDGHKTGVTYLTLQDLSDEGFTLLTTEKDTDPEVLELTLQDIADKFEVDVKTIKIKEVER